MLSVSALRKPRASAVDEVMHLLPLWPHERNDHSYEGQKKRIVAIEHALREERRHARSGDRAYDLKRHAALSKALKEARRTLAGSNMKRGCDQPPARASETAAAQIR
jgi:hypothetical protein